MAEDRESLPVLRMLSDGTPDLVDTERQLSDAVEQLAQSSAPVAVDTERAQGFRYGAEAWLVQVRRPDVGTFLIDTNALPDLSELSAVLDAPWIFHSGSQDLPSLKEVGMVPESLFDTEIAARLVGVEHFSLQGACETMLGFTLEKAHQNENWSVRPLPRSWLRYAAMDVEVLPQLREALSDRLDELGRQEWAEQEFAHALTHPVVARTPRWQNLKGVGSLRHPRELAVARELWETREQIAKEQDVSPGRLLNARGILAAAQENPQTKRSLGSIEFFRRPQARRYSEEWWRALRRAQGLTDNEMPTRADLHVNEGIPPLRAWKRSRPSAVQRLQSIRSLTESAAEPLGVAADMVLLPATQRAMAWEPLGADDPLTHFTERLTEGEARPWQQQLLLEQVALTPKKLDRLTEGD